MVSLPTYDSSKVSSLSLSQTQIGYSVAGTYYESGVSVAWSAFPYGVSFDFSIDNDSERGLVLAPRIPFTSATDDLAGTGETATTWDFTISTNLASVTASAVGTVDLYGVVSPTPSDFGTGHDPGTLLATTDSTFLIKTVLITDSNWVLNGSTYDLVFELDFPTNYTETVAGAVVRSPLHTIVNSPLWNGVVQFIFDGSATVGGAQFTALTFAGNTHSWHTGAAGYPLDQRGRAVHDYITGQPYFSPKAVPDGYREGIMVHPDNYDPPDPTEEDPWTPPPEEGVTDDEIIDVEN